MEGDSAVQLDGALPPLIAHIVYRFAVGGLENGLVNLINHLPRERYRHAIICLTEYTEFRHRIQRNDVFFFALHKTGSQDLGMHIRLWKILCHLHPDIVHTRNLPALECLVTAALARVPGRIHGEHGRDVYDLDGSNFKYNLLRKVIRPAVSHYITVSADLADWLIHTVGVHADRVKHIYNGVDVQRFHPRIGPRPVFGPDGFAPPGTVVVGTVGRMEAVKDQLTLVRAFLHLLATEPGTRERVRLVMIGDGSLREESQKLLHQANAEQLAWLPGERADIPELLRALDLFVLPSIAEGISNTILEAMASGLPIIATRVGGNPELVMDGYNGMLVPPADPVAIAKAISSYLTEPENLRCHGRVGQKRVEEQFSIEAMINGYLAVYDDVLSDRRWKTDDGRQRAVD
jgi:sugar transferase (PEP-CTERM/EpsH1 system associated)